MKRRIGIIGLGEFGKNHLNALRRSDYFDLVGACDIVQKDLGRVEFFQEPRDLFTIAKPEAVIIATPTKNHKESILEALKYVKYILVESPCTTSLEQAREMRYAAHSNSAKIVVGFNLRFHPTIEALKREFKKESEIYSINIIKGVLGGDLDDMLLKDLDLIRYLTLSEIVLFDSKRSKPDPTKEVISSSMKLKNGILVNIILNSLYPSNRHIMEISASSGVYVADLVNFAMHKFTQNGRINLKVDSEDFSLNKEHTLFAEICNGAQKSELADIDDVIKIREILR
ncbi:Gfo/Idh/MocA family protein [Campylobacter corcagiensis]|uniref:Gfo/Idh/MocA family oxidoreductase n=1 Tax=Campylobacter corcagiensis TaxID=1448857 RepID=A0A7M1LE51_9BACT|nr:Gfo/Idh/MocA family oxidoreductase [Campylobacter corcagiensis]QKF65018.1 oxidoreductase, Gfo/Idh/MocA family [Campylobacter corcagiensis]QOQ86828.1 Gfo/Idh/MocA family oxidoreductase [Campylobacter corcagiensis]